MREASKMMREAKIDTIVQVLTVPVQMYAVVSGCKATRFAKYRLF